MAKKKATKKATAGSKPSGAASGGEKRTFAVATNPKKAIPERVAAMAQSPLAVCGNEDNLQSMLTVLGNKDEPVEVRLAALQAIQAASFSVISFESCRGDYIATLRKIADDPDPEIRQRVLGILA